MNMMTVALSDFKLFRERFFPEIVSGNVKSGAFVPSEIMVEGVTAINFYFTIKFFTPFDFLPFIFAKYIPEFNAGFNL